MKKKDHSKENRKPKMRCARAEAVFIKPAEGTDYAKILKNLMK